MNDAAVVQQLDALIELAKERGIEIRHVLLDGGGGGICEIRGRPCLFLDLSSGPAEQLETIRQSLLPLPLGSDVNPGTSI